MLRERLNPTKWDYQAWRKFFLIAALWNFTFIPPALLFPSFEVRLMYGLKTSDFYILYLNTAFFLTVLVFGIGYLIIAYDPGKNLGIILMGIIAKTMVGIGFYYLFSIDKVTLIPVFGGTVDLLFTLYFIYYLIKGPRSELQNGNAVYTAGTDL